MTRIGKCSICRERKVKCDEKRPKCGQCMIKNRPCRYDYGKVSKFVQSSKQGDVGIAIHVDSDDSSDADLASGRRRAQSSPAETTILSVRSTKEAKFGNGTFHIFTPVRLDKDVLTSIKDLENALPHRTPSPFPNDAHSPSILHSPSCPETSLRAQFVSLVCAKPLQSNPSFLWGSWVTLIPSRIGDSRALDAATACFIAGSTAHRHMTDANISAARGQYSKALRSLQIALLSDEESQVPCETLTAIKLLSAFETFMGIETNRWVSHTRGLVKLFLARGPLVDEDDIIRSLFYSTLPLEFTEACLNGTDSAFDSPDWLYTSPPSYDTECSSFRPAYRAIMQQMVRIPRLIRFVRELRLDPSNTELGTETLALAEKLYESNLDNVVTTALSIGAHTEPTRDPLVARWYPDSIVFDSVNIFESLMRYCYCRILIAGCCQTLDEIFPFSPLLQDSDISGDELCAADYIAMSTQYAEDLLDPMPLGPLLIILPLQISFGTWWRRERSHLDILDEDVEKSTFMKTWTKEKSNEMLRIWRGKERSKEVLEVEMAALEGGALMPWMKRRVTPL